jgi:peptide/nickel transport system permease protein
MVSQAALLDPAVAEAPGAPAIRCDDVAVRFITERRTVTALENVSFEIAEGSFLSLLGPSGCGKSTLLRVVADLVPPTEGRVTVLGGSAETARRDHALGFVFQDAALLPWRTAIQNVSLPLEVGGRSVLPPGSPTPTELLALVGLSGWENAYPHELSGGMRQRVGIAMALANDPDIIIADEPTTALDVTVQAQVLALLDELRQSRGLAILFITHDFGVVAQLCDRVAVMYGGRIVETGPTAGVLAAPAHPYTKRLIACVPELGGGRRALAAIPGLPPAVDDLPPGCAFAPRCDKAKPVCRQGNISLTGALRQVRCLFPEVTP